MAYRFTSQSGASSTRRDVERDADLPPEPSSAGWFDSSFDLRRGLEVIELDMAWPDTEPVAGAIG